MGIGDCFEVEFIGMAYGGDAIAKLPDGRAVFVPFVSPGENAEITLVEERKGYARGELKKLLKSSANRIIPRCSHFGICGGCQYQHIEYTSQLEIKRKVLSDMLIRIAGVAEPAILPVVPSPASWFYRNTVQFHLTNEGRVGYQKFASHEAIAINECFLPEGVINEIWPKLQFEPSVGIDRLGFRAGKDNDVILILESQSLPSFEFELDLPISAVHLSPTGEVVLAGNDYCVIDVKERPFKVSAGSFFQVNTLMAEAMVDYLIKELSPKKGSVLFDLYCGVGLFSSFFAPLVNRIVAIEVNESACDDFTVNLDEFENVDLFIGRAETILPSLDIRPDIVILDPPRSGLDRAALKSLVALAPDKIAYVSCDPATLSRDLKGFLSAGYKIELIAPFDLFPQTYHIESITLLKRN